MPALLVIVVMVLPPVLFAAAAVRRQYMIGWTEKSTSLALATILAALCLLVNIAYVAIYLPKIVDGTLQLDFPTMAALFVSWIAFCGTVFLRPWRRRRTYWRNLKP